MNKNKENEVQTSAGVLLYRFNPVTKDIEVMLVTSNNPTKFNKRVWNIPKGHIEKGQSLSETAVRQFQEETGILLDQNQKSNLDYIGLCCTKKGKHVHIFGLNKDVNGGKQRVNIKSIMIEVDDPKNPGQTITIPQTTAGKYFPLEKAYNAIFNYQIPILDILKRKLNYV